MAGEQSVKDIAIVGEPSLSSPRSLSAEARADAAAFKDHRPLQAKSLTVFPFGP
jgi:hypothetical protein